jgi:hypothetical protein
MASRAKPKRRTRVAPSKKPKATKQRKPAPPLTPEQLQARDAFFEALDAKQRSDWKLGDLATHWSSDWKATARYRGFKRFYADIIVSGRKDTAPSYSTLTLYGRVAGAWPAEIAVRFGMAKLGLLYAWLTLKQFKFPADPTNVQLQVPQNGTTVVKIFAEATEREVQQALAAAKKPTRRPTPLSAREAWLIKRIDQGLEDYHPGSSALLHASPGPNGLTFALAPSPARHFIELIECVHDALRKDVPGDDEPNG